MLPSRAVNAKGSTSDSPPRPLVLAAILAAAALMLAVTGYSFGGGNHEVYLLEPLRRAGLATFGNDWFVHDTLQYHGLFAAVAATLFRLNVARGGFLVIFLILLGTTAWAWWRLVRALGGGVTAYLVAVVLYHVLLGDRGLGMYSLLQDGQFNAGNVAAVALLVGIVLWVEGRAVWSGVAFGVAGAFHLNYAVVAPVLWVALTGWSLLSRERSERNNLRSLRSRLSKRLLLASALALVPSVLNVASALPSKLRAEGTMPLPRFVELYVRLRHPHHYDPTAWPWWVWAAFLLPIPFAARAFSDSRAATPPRSGSDDDDAKPGPGRRCRPAVRRAAHVWLLLMALQAFALLTAGLFWLGPTFVQLSLWRFSPHAKLLAVSAAAVWLVTPKGVSSRPAPTSFEESDDAEAGRLLTPSAGPRFKSNRRWWAAALLTAAAPAVPVLILLAGIAVIQRTAQGAGDGLVRIDLLILLGQRVIALSAVIYVFAAIVGRDVATRWASLAVAASILLLMVFPVAGGSPPPPPGQPRPDVRVTAAAEWAKFHSPPDALFLLPPNASAFSVNARRGQVVSFKLVPQLAGELSEWDRRLRDVLDVPDLSVYAGGFTGYRTAQRKMRERYDALPTQHLFAVARDYGARYVFRSNADPAADAPVVWRGTGGAVLYDLGQPQ